MQKHTITLSALISAMLIAPTIAIAMPTDANDNSLTTNNNSATSELTAPVDRTLPEENIDSNEQLSDEEQIATQSTEVIEAETTVASTSEAASISQDIVDEPSLASQELDPLPVAAPIQNQQPNDTSNQTSADTDTDSLDNNAMNTPITLQETRKIIVR